MSEQNSTPFLPTQVKSSFQICHCFELAVLLTIKPDLVKRAVLEKLLKNFRKNKYSLAPKRQ